MKNNWNLWKKVKSQDVEAGQRQIQIDFTLPINVTNLLIQFSTTNTSKPFGKAEKYSVKAVKPNVKKQKKAGPQIESIHDVKGIDSVIMTLPKSIAAKLGYIQSKEEDKLQRDEHGSIIDSEQMNCPRCARPVQGKHGICNQCGENAMQCTYCRNINYEKPDGFLCNECGNSRFAKFDISFLVKSSFACEKIETEEAKTQALSQIDVNLQNAQNNYQQ